jgi:hypothetical protein
MIELLVFLFASIGMAHIMVDGTIFNPFKTWLAAPSKWKFLTWCKGKLLNLMNCYQCSGFWAGLFTGLMMWANGSDPLYATHGWSIIPIMFVYACAGSFASTFVAIIAMSLQRP